MNFDIKKKRYFNINLKNKSSLIFKKAQSKISLINKKSKK